MKRALLVLAGCFLVVSCAAPEVVQTGPNTYMLARTSAGGAFTNASKLKAETIRDANAFAMSKGKVAEGIGSNFERPIQGFPTFEYQFRLVDPHTRGTEKAIPSDTVKVQHE